jgi:hypothetical protein
LLSLVISWSEGDGRQGFRFWPFYGRETQEKEGAYEKTFYLWPFIQYARGRVHFFFPALMPADWDGPGRHYGLLFRIFEHYEDGQGL